MCEKWKWKKSWNEREISRSVSKNTPSIIRIQWKWVRNKLYIVGAQRVGREL